MAPGTHTKQNGHSKRPYGVRTVGTPQASSSIQPLKRRRRRKRTRQRAARQAIYDLQVSRLCSLMSNLRISDGPSQDFAQRIVWLSPAAWGQKASGQLIPRPTAGKKEPMGVDRPALALARSGIQLGKRGMGPGIPCPGRKVKAVEVDTPQNAKRMRLANHPQNDGRHSHGQPSHSKKDRRSHGDRSNGYGRHRPGHPRDSNRRH